MLSPNIEFITPTAMNMPSMSKLVKTIVTMEQLFQLLSLHMVRTTQRGSGNDERTEAPLLHRGAESSIGPEKAHVVRGR